MKISNYKIIICSLLIYSTIYILLFYPFLVNPLLPGQSDSWYNLGMFCDYSYQLTTLFKGESIVAWANYPEDRIYLYGEPSFLSAVPFTMLQWLSGNNRLAFILFYILIFVLNSLSLLFLFLKTYKVSFFTAFLLPLFFCLSSFHLGNLDNITYLIFFPTFFSLLSYHHWLYSNRWIHLYLSGLLLGSQLYFAVYNFVIGGMFLLIWIMSMPKARKAISGNFQLVVFVLVLTFPFLYLYKINSVIPSYYQEFFTPSVIDNLGFSFTDFARSFSSNPIYGNAGEKTLEHHKYWRLGNPGIGTSFFVLLGALLSLAQRRYEVILLIALGGLLAMGPYITDGIPSLTYVCYKLFDFLSSFKLIFKFYHLVIIGLMLGICYLFIRLEKVKYGYLGILFITLLFLLENLPTRIKENSMPFDPQPMPKAILEKISQPNAVSLMLPAYTPALPDNNDQECLVKGRIKSYRYYFIAIANRFRTLNGGNGYIPHNRLQVHKTIKNLPLQKAMKKLKDKYGLRYVIYDNDSLHNCRLVRPVMLRKLITPSISVNNYLLFDLKNL